MATGFTNQLFTNDNLYVLHGMNSESVDLIYLDPPFNTKRTYAAPIGSRAAGASFKDMWTWRDVDEQCLENLVVRHSDLVDYIAAVGKIHGKPMMSYLTYMTQRILEMHRVLKSTGSFYLHCDQTASHYLKVALDCIFGADNFHNDIVWDYRVTGAGNPKRAYQKRHDNILYYSKSGKPKFNIIKDGEPTERMQRLMKAGYNKVTQANGKRYLNIYDRTIVDELVAVGKLDLDEFDVIKEFDASQGKRFVDVFSLDRLIGTDSERTGYPTQKPLALMRRIIQASSNPGDIVFDPFCGCATTCVAAQQLRRHWIGIDIEANAADLLVRRLSDDAGVFHNFAHRTDLPQRTDLARLKWPRARVRKHLFGEQEGRCNGCGALFAIHNFHVDHIFPKSKGGAWHLENLQLLCGHCNSVKGDRPMEYLHARLRMINRQASMFGA